MSKCLFIVDIPRLGGVCRIHVSGNGHVSDEISQNHCIFDTEQEITYEPFCDDFGPLNFVGIVEFCRILDEMISTSESPNIVYTAKNGPRGFTNAAFLLGAFMILKLRMNPDAVQSRFSQVDRSLLEAYRDATYEQPVFKLNLIDCWRGLRQARALKWIQNPEPNRREWGMIDPAEYTHYDNPLNCDMNQVVPGKFLAFKGPIDLGGKEYVDKIDGGREFSPSYYASIFKALGVTTVIRLNAPRYNGGDFLAHGIQHFDLYFEDCTAPPSSIVRRFLHIAESAPGMVAVHCTTGLGRTGTLIALYMMKHHGFTAREAMGWLRIMRPGSVIGLQQDYLCSMERRLVPLIRSQSARAKPPSAIADVIPTPTLQNLPAAAVSSFRSFKSLRRSNSEVFQPGHFAPHTSSVRAATAALPSLASRSSVFMPRSSTSAGTSRRASAFAL